jgi:CDP-glucose 4,6-dehydratase
MNFQDTFKSRRVLVTGDTGFKGSWLCEWLLAEGAEVYGLGLAPNTEPALFDQLDLANRIHHSELDIRDAEALRDYVAKVDPEIVLHLAAQPLVRLSYDIPVETYATNVMGTVHLLDAIRHLSKGLGVKGNVSGIKHPPLTTHHPSPNTHHPSPTTHNPIAVICVTTDKCYENKEWLHSYREEDPMGGHDPYSSSKGACEIAIQSFRKSYFNDPLKCGVAVASARAGNVIGGGDWALDRIVPDCVRALQAGEAIPVRNKVATRPWQHVLEPLSGYLLLAAELWRGLNGQAPIQANFECNELCGSFNFGPTLKSNRPVSELVTEVIKHWPGDWLDQSDPEAVHEASLLNLSIDKAHHMLDWQPRWNFAETIEETVKWYRAIEQDPKQAATRTKDQIAAYTMAMADK